MTADRGVLRLALKYCGGCNPDYDRVAVAASIRARLDGRVEFVTAGDGSGVDIVLLLAGCETACADLDQFAGSEIMTVTSRKKSEVVIERVLKRTL